MAARQVEPPPGRPSFDIEAGNKPETDFQRAVHQPLAISWGSVAAVVTVISIVVSSIFWLDGRIEQNIEEEIKPVSDKVTSLHTKFDSFEATYAEDKLNHLKEFHTVRNGIDGDD